MRSLFSSLAQHWIAWLALIALATPPIKAADEALLDSRRRQDLPLSERGAIIVGATSDSYPHAYVGPGGKWTGFSADVLEAVSRVMHLELHRVIAPGMEVQRRFRNGEFDMLQMYSETPARDEFADFSVPFLTLQGTIFVQKHLNPIHELSDFNGKKFAIIGKDSIGEHFIRDHHLQVQAVYVSSSEEGLRLVDEGTCTGTFLSYLTALAVIERTNLHNVAMFGDPFLDYDIRHCFAVHKGDTQLLARLNEGLAVLNRTGEFQQIYDRWFGNLESPMISRRLAFRWGTILLAVIVVGALGGWFYQRVLRKLIAQQTAELSRQKALLQALYDNIPMAICLLEREPEGFRVLSINRQAEPWVGRSTRRAEGHLLSELDSQTEWLRLLGELLLAQAAKRELIQQEMPLLESRKRVIFTLVPMTPSPEGRDRLCVLGEDVTERRTLDEEISQSRRLRAIGELVGGIAHEFNNLLTPIIFKLSEIQLESKDELLRSELQLVSDAAERASELTRRLLTFGHKVENRVEEIRLDSIVKACFALLKLAVDRRIIWEAALPANLPPLHFNPTDLNQIVLNLILNARDTLMEKLAAAHADGWTPTIRAETAYLPADAVERMENSAPSRRQILGWQRLTVRDNGMGITPEVRERIFEPFYTTKDVGKGTGLGLATVWHLVTQASGRIEVESTPGYGSAFHVYLPMIAGASAVASRPVQFRRGEAGTAQIFLAEDDQPVASAVASTLQRAGHSVMHEVNGTAAWRHLQENIDRYDLLVLDINMPGLDGIELAQRVRNTGRFHGGILVISGRVSSDDLRHLADAKVDRVLNKPFERSEFLAAVHDCLAAAQKRAAAATA